jgi:hypothetical protein
MVTMLDVTEELLAEDLRSRRADIERYCRTREQLAVAGAGSPAPPLRTRAAGVLLRLAAALDRHCLDAAQTAPAARAS